MQRLSLSGAWQLSSAKVSEPIAAWVPGCVHTALLAAGQLKDPFYRDQEHQAMWIGETDWVYRRSFELTADDLSHDRLLLCCHGLDTLATILVNGSEVGTANNMFRTWEFELAGVAKAGTNTIEVCFAAPLPYVRELEERVKKLPCWGVGAHKLNGGGWIRKEPCNFGWDWGPMLTTCGIWRELEILGLDSARLSDIHVAQEHEPGQVTVLVAVAAESFREEALTARVALHLDGESVASVDVALKDGQGLAELVVENPRLWWPNGLGEQTLYELTVELLRDGTSLDQDQRRLGLRTLRLVQEDDQWGRSFCFACNGVTFFSKGANWIPAETFATEVTRETYARLIGDAAAANMNMLRVWGGGIYENDDFYDLCDEHGICVWQDFMFACATYPSFDAAWMQNVEAEARDNVKRLRHHACLALWCGNNELEQGLVGPSWNDHQMSWEDYSKLFDELLPKVVGELDPDRDYWPCSPHSPVGERTNFNNPNCGDAHLWSVWHGKQPFEWYRTCEHRFNSEFGFQSFPEPRTVEGYTEPEDRNLTSYVMEHHQRSGIGNSTIIHYLLDWFRLPTSFDMQLWLSQVLQGMAMKYAVEHWRRSMPRGMGTIYWQLNDCWPVASWSSIDYHGRWKALQYMARRFFAPLLVSGVEDLQAGTVDVHVTSDRLQPAAGVVKWRLTDVDGRMLDGGELPVIAQPRCNQLVTTLRLADQLRQHGARALLLWLELNVDGLVVSDNLVTFARPKHMEFSDPGLVCHAEPLHDGRYRVVVTAEKPALWTWVETGLDLRYTDAFVHLRRERPWEVILTPQGHTDPANLHQGLIARSLWETYQS